MDLKTIHLEHALPALAELGLETLIPLMGGRGFEEAAVGRALQGLAGGAEKHAARHLVAIASATAEELLTWESSTEAKDRALEKAALVDLAKAKEAVTDFFASLGPFLPSTPGSSEPVKAAPAKPKAKPKPKASAR